MNKLFTILPFVLILSQAQSQTPQIPVSLNFHVGDFNGDGLDDIFRHEKGASDDDEDRTAQIYYSTINDPFASVVLPEEFYLKGDLVNIYIGDFNGDGMDDFIRQEKNYWDDDEVNTASVFYSTGSSFQNVPLPEQFALKGDLTKLYVGDFNGDGLDDFVRQERGAWDDDSVNTAQVFLATASQGQFQKIDVPEDFGLSGDLTNLYIGDFDGNGTDDILRQEKAAWDDDRVNTAYVLLSNGQGTFTKVVLPEEFDLAGDLTNLYIGDFNGDGKADILRQEKAAWDDDRVNTAYLLISTGGGSFRKIILSEDFDLQGDLTNLFIGDFNGDMRDDILRQEKGPWDDDELNTAYLLLSDGNDSFQKVVLRESLYIKGDLGKIYVGDFNGDGKDDFIYHENGRTIPYLYYSNGAGDFYMA